MKFIVLLCISIIAIAATRNTKTNATQQINVAKSSIALDTPPTKTPLTDTTTKAKKNNEIFGIASFYSNSFEGKPTATGETFRQKGMTCASNNIPLGTWIKVTNIKNNKSVIVKVNDRMAPSMARKGRVTDLTLAAAQHLDFVSSGLTRVKVEILGKKKPL